MLSVVKPTADPLNQLVENGNRQKETGGNGQLRRQTEVLYTFELLNHPGGNTSQPENNTDQTGDSGKLE